MFVCEIFGIPELNLHVQALFKLKPIHPAHACSTSPAAWVPSLVTPSTNIFMPSISAVSIESHLQISSLRTLVLFFVEWDSTLGHPLMSWVSQSIVLMAFSPPRSCLAIFTRWIISDI